MEIAKQLSLLDLLPKGEAAQCRVPTRKKINQAHTQPPVAYQPKPGCNHSPIQSGGKEYRDTASAAAGDPLD